MQQGRFDRRQFAIFPFAAAGVPSNWRVKPLISIVLPVYNHGAFVAKSIASVLETRRHALELIVVDDGSTDDTPEILSRLPHDPRLKLLRQENRGLAQALNRGFAETKGAFTGWTSADNCYLPGALDRLAHFLSCNPAVGLVYANVQLIDENGNPLRNSRYRFEDQHPEDSSVLRLALAAETLFERNDNFVNACVLFRSELKSLVGQHHPELLGFEDYDYWLRISLQQRLAHLDSDDVLYQYRLHQSSLTASLTTSTLSSSQYSSVQKTRTAYRALALPLSFSLELNNAQPASWVSCCCTAFVEAGYRIEKKQQTLAATAGNSPFLVSAPAYHSDDRELKTCLDEAAQLQLHCYAGQDATFSCTALARYYEVPSSLRVCLRRTGSNSQSAELIVLPPLRLPQLFRRARDCSFRAVTGGKSSLRTVLIFSPDELGTESYELVLSSLSALIERQPQYTFVLYCTNNAQRKTADRLNLSLESNENLRIIDVSEQSIAEESLLFVLSSVDLVCTLKAPFPTLAGLLELRAEAGLAALAGLPMLLLTLSAVLEEELETLSAQTLALPHLAHFQLFAGESVATLSEARMTELAGLFAEVGSNLSFNSLEQYLETLSPSTLGRKLAALFFSAQPLQTGGE